MFTSLGAQWMFETDMRDNLLERSLKFEDGDSPYLLRTPSGAGNKRSFAISMWVKRGNLGSNHILMNVFVTASPNNQGVLRFNSSDQLQFTNFSGEYDIVTNGVFRDTTSWFHIVVRVDTTQSTASERIKLYVNGTLQTSLATSTYPTQNLDLEWNTANKHLIGARTDNSTPTPIQEFDGYLADVKLVDGEALGPESFGRDVNGVWLPKDYTGDSCGYNGFELDFAKTSTGAEYTPPSSAFTDDADQQFKLVEASNGTTSFTDEEGASISRVGNTIHSNAAAKFGSTSVYFDGSGDNLSVGGNGYLYSSLNGANKTLEAWVYPTAYHYGWIMSYSTNQHYHGFAMNTNETNAYLAYGGNNGGSVSSQINGGVFPALNQWYHIAMQRDASTVSFLFNGELIGTHSSPGNNPTGTRGPLKIGSQHYYGGSNRSFFQGYMDEVRISNTGSRYSYSYGNSLGADASGRGNHFAPNGFVSTDVVIDNPDNNFATPIGAGIAESQDYQSYYQPTSSEGNLKVTGSSSGWSNGSSNFGVASGKWYAECIVNSWVNSQYVRIGLRARPARTYDEYFVLGNGTGQLDGSARNSRLPSFSTGDVIQFALDLENQAFYLGKNGTWGNSATTAEIEAGTTTNAFASGSEVPINDGHEYFFYAQPHSTSTSITWNFGQDDTFNGEKTTAGNTDANGQGKFQYEPPSGFLAQCAANLEESLISPNPSASAAPGDFFNTVLYTGNDGTQTITGVGFQPDWVWIKARNQTRFHNVFDSLRGTGRNIRTNSTNAEVNDNDTLTAFTTDGFSLGNDGTGARGTNYSTDNYVAWCWKAGGAPTATNTGGRNPTAGSVMIDGVASTDPLPEADIYPTKMSVNTISGFSIVLWTGDGNASVTIGHGLNETPELIIYKGRDSTYAWPVWYKTFSTTSGFFLNATNSAASHGRVKSVPTNTVIGNVELNYTNELNKGNIAYCFHSVEGYSKIGSYTGNGNADGVFVYTGFRPAWIMTKKSSGSGNWYINDSARSPLNPTSSFGANLYADLSNAESGNGMDMLSNGFKIRNTDSSQNTNGSTYIYMAFAEAESKQANAR